MEKKNEQQLNIPPGAFEDPTLQKESGIDPQETLAAIRESFDREIEAPTSETEGSFVQ